MCIRDRSRAVEETLIRRNIPYKIYGGLRFYDRKEIKDMLAYMKLIVNPKDVVSLMTVSYTHLELHILLKIKELTHLKMCIRDRSLFLMI